MVSGKVLCYVKVVLKVDLDIDFVGETYAMKIPKQGHYKDLLERQIKALAGASQSIDWEISPSEFDLNDSVIGKGSSGEIRRAIWGGPPIEKLIVVNHVHAVWKLTGKTGSYRHMVPEVFLDEKGAWSTSSKERPLFDDIVQGLQIMEEVFF
ncbi:unnamed protein product [Sphagnum troendelagicum]|uniref:Uncharacterized protein n=1 Tax=Sphagnum troendelagicum TaxID=128251 RepID=A0ABP0UTC4_9BRYO